MGGAGVQALDSLQRRGLLELRGDYVPYLEQRYEPDFPDADHERSLWMGETGIRLTLQRLSPSRENADRLHELIGANTQDERREVMWGSPGTMLAAAATYDLTGEARWLDLWRESATWLRGEWDPQTGLWTQQLYGMVDQFIGPTHGFAVLLDGMAACRLRRAPMKLLVGIPLHGLSFSKNGASSACHLSQNPRMSLSPRNSSRSIPRVFADARRHEGAGTQGEIPSGLGRVDRGTCVRVEHTFP